MVCPRLCPFTHPSSRANVHGNESLVWFAAPDFHHQYWTFTETPLGHPAVSLSHGDPAALVCLRGISPTGFFTELRIHHFDWGGWVLQCAPHVAVPSSGVGLQTYVTRLSRKSQVLPVYRSHLPAPYICIKHIYPQNTYHFFLETFAFWFSPCGSWLLVNTGRTLARPNRL